MLWEHRVVDHIVAHVAAPLVDPIFGAELSAAGADQPPSICALNPRLCNRSQP